MIGKDLYILSLVFLTACNAQNTVTNYSGVNKVNVVLDSILIEKSEQEKMDYFRFKCYTANYKINVDSTLSLLYMMNSSHIIDFNLTSGNIEKIPIAGKNPLNSGFLSLMKINNYYSILNAASELFEYQKDTLYSQETVLNAQSNFSDQNVFVTADLGFSSRPPFESDSSIIIVVADGSKNKNTFAKVNLLNKETTLYDFKRHKEYFKYHHPLRMGIRIETFGDTLLVNYQFSEKIDLFSLKSGKYIGSKMVKSKYQNEPIPYLTSNKNDFENERYPIEADYYDGLTYNPYKKCYYRIYYHTLPRMNENDEYTISADKVVSIAIFDLNFNWIGEQIVNRKNYIAGIVPHPEGALGLFGNRHEEKYYLSLVRHD